VYKTAGVANFRTATIDGTGRTCKEWASGRG
jgi:hypothetical protein